MCIAETLCPVRSRHHDKVQRLVVFGAFEGPAVYLMIAPTAYKFTED